VARINCVQQRQVETMNSGDQIILQAENVYKTYRLGIVSVPVLRGVDVKVNRGGFVAILGASGSGKSTLMHLLGGLDRPTPLQDGNTRSLGRVLFEGKDIARFSVAEADMYRRKSVGFVFQFYHLLPELTVVENVTIAAMIRHGRLRYKASEVEPRAKALLETFGLGHRLKHRPAELSGGERQRVAIARALINEPPVLLADEPTGNLDRVTGASILDQIDMYRRTAGLTLVMVTHDQEIAARADRIIKLVDGKVVAAQATR